MILNYFKKALSIILKFDNYKIARKYNLISVKSGLYYLKSLGFYPKTIIDVGAFEGYWSKSVNLIFKDSRFYLVEPQVEKIEIIKNNVKGNNFKVFNTLLGKNDNEVKLFYQMGTGSSYYYENTFATREEVEIKTVSLDTFVLENDIKLEDTILKLDTQGSELDIIRGGENSLKKIDFLLIELSLVNYNLNAPNYLEILNYLNENDFVLFDVLEIHRSNQISLPTQFDGLFVNKKSSFYEKNIKKENFI
jgi:FkbM family methyltransferase